MRAGISRQKRSALAGVVRFDEALPPLLFEAICKFALDFASHGNPKGTFWHAFEAGPRTCIGAAASTLSKLLPATKGCVGVEWWIRSGPAETPMALHFDKDESLARETARMRHPVYSGVLYLTDDGGPTVILDQAISEDGQILLPPEPGRVVVSPPLRNGFLAFPGHLRHGVLADSGAFAEAGVNFKRSTLLLNWWLRRPAPPSCAELPLGTFGCWSGELDLHIPKAGKLRESSIEGLSQSWASPALGSGPS